MSDDTMIRFCGVSLDEAERGVRDYPRIERALAATQPVPWYIAGHHIIPFTRAVIADVTMRPMTRWERLTLWFRRVTAR